MTGPARQGKVGNLMVGERICSAVPDHMQEDLHPNESPEPNAATNEDRSPLHPPPGSVFPAEPWTTLTENPLCDEQVIIPNFQEFGSRNHLGLRVVGGISKDFLVRPHSATSAFSAFVVSFFITLQAEDPVLWHR